MIKTKILEVIKRVNDAANKSLYKQKVQLVAISKTKPVQDIMSVYEAGVRHFGQNYVNEIQEKHEHLPKDINWHFVGHLQSNKIKKVLVPNLFMIQTVDRTSLADKLNLALKQQNRELNVLVQVKTSEEETKSGVEIDDLPELVKHILQNCKQLRFKGLMTIGRDGDIDAFKKMYQLRQEIATKFNLKKQDLELSMGMSSDFQQAILEGSTIVRVGSLLFGPRQPRIK